MVELLETTAQGGKVKRIKPTRKKEIDDVGSALEASLNAMRKSA